MKNNFLRVRILIFLLISYFFSNTLFSKEVNFKAVEILTYEEGNVIVGKNEVEAKIENEVEIFADKITYNKKEEKWGLSTNSEKFENQIMSNNTSKTLIENLFTDFDILDLETPLQICQMCKIFYLLLTEKLIIIR